MCVDSKGDANTPVNLWECHQQGGNQVKSLTNVLFELYNCGLVQERPMSYISRMFEI